AVPPPPPPPLPARRLDDIGPEEQACLDAATELYHNRLLSDTAAGGPMAYVTWRGLDPATLATRRVGYAAGDELADFLRWRRLPLAAARRAGLLGRGRREYFAKRIVVPERRGRHTAWLVGRSLAPATSGPRYLGLPGRKPLMGWDAARQSRWVVLAEGVFDWLTLCVWGLPALSLVGTHASGEMLEALSRFERIVIAFDRDEAGVEAAQTLACRLPGAVVLDLPALDGVKDIADLALRPDGRARFFTALAGMGVGDGAGALNRAA
ncbi:MAG TPA: toprim domain-containing protein, partial [Chloroflexota bacterium]|nr:toprim domain-containing protein [Chloroflexota bacterium]